MARQPLSVEDTNTLMEKLKALRVKIIADEENYRKEIAKKEEVVNTMIVKLKTVRKEMLASGAELTSAEFRTSVGNYLRQVRDEVDYIRQNRAAKTLVKTPIRVVISGAAGQIGYALLPLFATGQVFGLDQPLVLNLLEIPDVLKALRGVAMELDDGSYPLLQEVVCTDDPAVAFKDVDFAVLVGGFPRKAGMLRKDLLARNAPIFKSMGEGLEKYAKDTCKVLVVANPANTNALTCAQNAPKIPKRNFAALTRLDYNRARSQVATKLGVPSRDVRNVIIWGNHSKTQVPDLNSGTVTRDGQENSIEVDEKWVTEFRTSVQQRGKAIIDARGFSSAMSAANAVKDCVRDWTFGTPPGEHVAMAVWSDGSYGVTEGIFYSFPVTCDRGEYAIVKNLRVTDDVRGLMKASEDELLEEAKEAGLL